MLWSNISIIFQVDLDYQSFKQKPLFDASKIVYKRDQMCVSNLHSSTVKSWVGCGTVRR